MAMGDRTPLPAPSSELIASLEIQSPQRSSVNIRLWRPAAQRNLRNQWSRLASLRHDWVSASSTARAYATSLVNSFLSQMYMDTMELGILSEMPDIRKKACLKLSKQQDLQRNKLLLSYRDMVGVVVNMINTSRSMRCYTKGGINSPVAQFSCFAENQNDSGDGGGIPVFNFWPVSHFEKLAGNFVQMFVLEINLKRLLVMEFLLLGNHQSSESNNRLSWLDEFYPGELENLNTCNSYSNEACSPGLPSHPKYEVGTSLVQPVQQHDRDVLQVYLTTWIAEVNIDRSRLDEVISEIGAEMHVTLP